MGQYNLYMMEIWFKLDIETLFNKGTSNFQSFSTKINTQLKLYTNLSTSYIKYHKDSNFMQKR